MPSSSQKINVTLTSTKGSDEVKDGGPESFENGDIINNAIKVNSPKITTLNDDQKLAFALRDFIGSSKATVINEESTPPPRRRLSETLPYIDEQIAGEDQSDDDRQQRREPDDTLNNADCRLRRWRAASRKLRRRVIKDLPGGDASKRNGSNDRDTCTDLADRLRNLAAAGGVSSSAGELLQLAPPPPAATAPPSPGCLSTPTLADQSGAEYFVSKTPNNK